MIIEGSIKEEPSCLVTLQMHFWMESSHLSWCYSNHFQSPGGPLHKKVWGASSLSVRHLTVPLTITLITLYFSISHAS